MGVVAYYCAKTTNRSCGAFPPSSLVSAALQSHISSSAAKLYKPYIFHLLTEALYAHVLKFFLNLIRGIFFFVLFFNLYNARIVTRSTVGTHFVRSFMVPRNCQLIVRTLLAYTVALPGPQLNSPPIFTLLCYVGHPQASRTLLEGSQTCVCVVFVPVLCCLECW